jgi:hypothetical protein
MGAPEGIRWATLAPGNDSLAARKKLGTARLYGQSKLVKTTSPRLILLSSLFNPLFCRATSCSRTNLLGDTAVKA